MAVQKPSARREKLSARAPTHVRGGPRNVTMEPFDRQAPAGTYPIDEFASFVPWLDGLVESDEQRVERLRFMVSQCGYRARSGAALDESDKASRDDALGYLEELQQVRTRCLQIAGRDTEPFQHFFAFWPAAIEEAQFEEIERSEDVLFAAGSELDNIARLASELASAIDAIKRDRPIRRAYNPTSSSPLLHRFVETMRTFWEFSTATEVPDSVEFARFLEAAWSSLEGFPGFGRDADPVGEFQRINKAKTLAVK